MSRANCIHVAAARARMHGGKAIAPGGPPAHAAPTRRTFLVGLMAGTAALVVSCGAPSLHPIGTPATTQLSTDSPGPAALAAPADSTLKGKRLNVLVGTFDAPANNRQTDDLGKRLEVETGMSVTIERLGNLQLPT